MKQLSIAEQARVFAVDRHGDLQYGQDLPYAWHLSKVADLAMRSVILNRHKPRDGYMIPLRIQIRRWMKSAALEGAPQKMGQWTATVGRYGKLYYPPPARYANARAS